MWAAWGALALGVGMLGGPVGPAGAQSEIEIVLPEPGPDQWPDGDGRHRVRIEIGGVEADRLAPGDGPGSPVVTAPGPRAPELARLDLGELSPQNGEWLSSQYVRVRIHSPWGFFPPYRITARRVPTGGGGPGDLSPRDVGMGVTRVRARNPVLDPRFDYDPRNVSKDVDDVPRFRGTLANLATGLPPTELFRTTRYGFGQSNEFWLAFVVGPQFFTPDPSSDFSIELTVDLI